MHEFVLQEKRTQSCMLIKDESPSLSLKYIIDCSNWDMVGIEWITAIHTYTMKIDINQDCLGHTRSNISVLINNFISLKSDREAKGTLFYKGATSPVFQVGPISSCSVFYFTSG